jgi:hypothetical protein
VAVEQGHSGSSCNPSSSTAECIEEFKFTDAAVRAGYMPSEMLTKVTETFSDSNAIKYCSKKIAYVIFPVKNHTARKLTLPTFTPGH